jgi:hypothetical protein
VHTNAVQSHDQTRFAGRQSDRSYIRLGVRTMQITESIGKMIPGLLLLPCYPQFGALRV